MCHRIKFVHSIAEQNVLLTSPFSDNVQAHLICSGLGVLMDGKNSFESRRDRDVPIQQCLVMHDWFQNF